MKTKIFKCQLLTLAAIAISSAVFAQEVPVAPPAPPLPPCVNLSVADEKALHEQLGKLKVKMQGLQKNMQKLCLKQGKQMTLVMKGFDKNFKDSFKDFGKTFSGSFNNMVPDVDFNGLSNSLSDADYQQKIASGQVVEKVKNYSKTYSVDANDLLQISNSFGKVTVNTWNRSEFKVDVQMKFGSDNEDYVNDMINGSNISDSKVGSTVSFKTNIYNRGSNNRGDNHIEINYTVYMPAGNPVDITNRFGPVTLPNLNGKATIRVSYGALNAQNLSNTDNDVQVKFGDANIAAFNGGKLNVAYGKLTAGTINNVNASISFGGFTAERLKNSAVVTVKYGNGFSIGTIDKSVRNLTINAAFSKINLDFKEAESFNFDIVTKFGGFHYDDDKVKVITKSPSDEERGWSSTKSYKGYIGKNNTDGKIAINASYTEVRFE